MGWTLVLTENDFRPVGEIVNAYDLTVSLPLSQLDTLSLRVRIDNPLADALLTTRGYIKGYLNGTLRFYGPMISAEESVTPESSTVAVNAVGAGWVFQKRFVGKSSAGDVSAAAVDRAQRFVELLDTVNTENDTGIEVQTASSASTVTYSTGPYKKLMASLQELSPGSDGFDWRVLPVDNIASGEVTGSKIGGFVAQPLIGSIRRDAVFEHGDGKNNIAAYSRIVSRDTQANALYHNAAPGPDAPGYPTRSALDASSISDWGLLEDLVEADLLNSTMRQQLVNEHRDVRKSPRQTLSITPVVSYDSSRVPQLGEDFDIGDVVVARAVRNNRTRFNVLARVWGIMFQRNNNGVDAMTLTLSEEAG
jgi:hypothetical protein